MPALQRGLKVAPAFAGIFATAFGALPRARRFGAAITVARLFHPLIARSSVYRRMARTMMNDAGETSLYLVLLALQRGGCKYEPVFTLEGRQHLYGLDENRATLLIGTHKMMSTFLVEHVQTLGREPIVIGWQSERMLLAGSPRPFQTIEAPSSSLLIKFRSALLARRTICAMIDGLSQEGRSVPYATTGGGVILSEALVKVAVRLNAQIVFVTSSFDRSNIVIRVARATDGASVHTVLSEFARFVKRETATDATELQKQSAG